ncbi:Voltage-dependent calcium channel subunit alpha-2/delta-3 [Sarcoptes scabiei]|uniref:Voltage-dependent calcium channel subunit alpha-2/delta-3 n=1 Tax=Sarcoptes scabiei TaxID=52283 RepID=A0A834VEC7_SARSC|nr:Voltage-dependent calcium channel subunit alpha-2/delta-3 [Sarcoptes scabiei]
MNLKYYRSDDLSWRWRLFWNFLLQYWWQYLFRPFFRSVCIDRDHSFLFRSKKIRQKRQTDDHFPFDQFHHHFHRLITNEPIEIHNHFEVQNDASLKFEESSVKSKYWNQFSSPSLSSSSSSSSSLIISFNSHKKSFPKQCSNRILYRSLPIWLLITMLTIVDLNGLRPIKATDELVFDEDVIKNMARVFGRELSAVSTEQTCLSRIQENFQHYSHEVSWFDGNKMMDDMRNDVMHMFNWKKHSVERIANESERLASNHTYDKNIGFDYFNVKRLTDKDLVDLNSRQWQRNPNFDDSVVNFEHSAIHLPINVNDKSSDVINEIKWSEHLTQFFKNNLAFDPSLSWQFFGSAKGFLRLYPATLWREEKNFTEKPRIDFYDCRLRPWYIKGAASSKDIVILLDTSGSMTGVRKSIGQSVLEHILDTLTEDDYVAALKFSKDAQPIHPCLNTLVQANKKNIAEIKSHLVNVKTNEFVNFTAALVEAFTFLQQFNRSGQGSQCNQAIMLITDGAPGTYEETFKQFNWPNIPVRVFTYLIGHDVTSHNEVYWMACHNRGYYTHVMNRAEVHEQVQKYIPVMSRPIVLSGERIFSWSPIYAPIYETELTEENWINKQTQIKMNRLRAQARYADNLAASRSLRNLNAKRYGNIDSEDQNAEVIQRGISKRSNQMIDDGDDEETDGSDDVVAFKQIALEPKSQKNQPISLFTTLSTPVFDTRNYTNVTKRILIKNVYQDADIETIRIANLLGVAGVDIPIKEIEKLTPAFKLGVNGYSFMINNNGYLLNHPDLRPTFEGFLKPFYHSVDMSEVELANNTLGPRQIDSDIDSIRSNMINRTHGWKKVAVKIHIDEMKRVTTRVNHYTHGMIGQTPFSLAIALPEPYGSYRLTSQVDLRMKYREQNFTHFFRGNQWRVHPNWVYCDHHHQFNSLLQQQQQQQQQPPEPQLTPEESILQFLMSDLEKQNFRWRTSSIRPKVYETILCDKDLIQSLVLDANLTDTTREQCSSNPNYRDEQRIKTFGIVSTFVSTRSGLTRFKDYRSKDEIKLLEDLPFYLKHDRAIEETYYKRSVDFYQINNDAFVYSVEFDSGEKHERRMASTHSHYDSNFLVTATHALFIGNLKHNAPVAVVGIQFHYDTILEFFLNNTNKFNVPCTHLDVDCYLVDNNAFIILSNHKTSDVGKFFGEIDGDILEKLIEIGVYKRVHLFDYQAICLDPEVVSGPSASFFNHSILVQLLRYLRSMTKLIAIFYLNLLYGSDTNRWSWWSIDSGDSFSSPIMTEASSDQEFLRQNNWIKSESFYGTEYSIGSDSFEEKTIPRACDKEFDLYEMIDFGPETKSHQIQCGSSQCSRNFLAQYIPHTNLYLVISINNPSCDCPKQKLSIEPKEVEYSAEEQCNLLKKEKYRRRPQGCYNYHPQV